MERIFAFYSDNKNKKTASFLGLATFSKIEKYGKLTRMAVNLESEILKEIRTVESFDERTKSKLLLKPTAKELTKSSLVKPAELPKSKSISKFDAAKAKMYFDYVCATVGRSCVNEIVNIVERGGDVMEIMSAVELYATNPTHHSGICIELDAQLTQDPELLKFFNQNLTDSSLEKSFTSENINTCVNILMSYIDDLQILLYICKAIDSGNTSGIPASESYLNNTLVQTLILDSDLRDMLINKLTRKVTDADVNAEYEKLISTMKDKKDELFQIANSVNSKKLSPHQGTYPDVVFALINNPKLVEKIIRTIDTASTSADYERIIHKIKSTKNFPYSRFLELLSAISSGSISTAELLCGKDTIDSWFIRELYDKPELIKNVRRFVGTQEAMKTKTALEKSIVLVGPATKEEKDDAMLKKYFDENLEETSSVSARELFDSTDDTLRSTRESRADNIDINPTDFLDIKRVSLLAKATETKFIENFVKKYDRALIIKLCEFAKDLSKKFEDFSILSDVKDPSKIIDTSDTQARLFSDFRGMFDSIRANTEIIPIIYKAIGEPEHKEKEKPDKPATLADQGIDAPTVSKFTALSVGEKEDASIAIWDLATKKCEESPDFADLSEVEKINKISEAASKLFDDSFL